MHTHKKVKTTNSSQSENHDDILGIELDDSEMQNLRVVINRIINYKHEALYDHHHQIQSLKVLPEHILILLPELKLRPQRILNCVEQNAYFLQHIVGGRTELFTENVNHNHKYYVGHVEDLLSMFVKEWSIEGTSQRSENALISKLIKKHLLSEQRILVAGSSLGRLPYQLAKAGKKVQAHQHRLDYFLAANFVLNFCGQRMSIYPYIHNFSNHATQEGPYRQIKIPDVLPLLDHNLDIDASLGDFGYVYQHQHNQWPCIVSCFYLERVPSAPRFMRAVKRTLQKGGLWINYGIIPKGMSLEEMMDVLDGLKFTVLEKGQDLYIPNYNQEKMMHTEYKTHWFVAQSPAEEN